MTRARFLVFAALCAACQRAGAPPAGADAELHDLDLAAEALVGSGELVVVLVREAEQGGLDLNGDGDADDTVVGVLDAVRGFLFQPGLAVAGEGGAPPLCACADGAVAFAVDEAAQGGRDLNGDGDALDRVVHVFERARGTVRNLGRAVRQVVAGGDLVAFAVDEAGDGGRDLDADGDSDGTLLVVHDLADGSTRELALRDGWPLDVHDGFLALRLSERVGLDLTLDGDDDDRAVFELYDGRTGLLQNTTLALANDAVASAGGTFGVEVSERGQGRGDLSGDGDDDDAVFFVYDPARGYSISLGLAVPAAPAPESDGERYLLRVFEAPNARDANGDGDRDDRVVFVFEPASGLLFDTGLAAEGSAALLGAHVAVSVSEFMQGASDLDGDGEVDGNVVHVLDLASGALQDLGLDTFSLTASGERLFLAPSEDLAALDWNQDGDRQDRVLFDWNSADGRTSPPRGAVSAVLAAAGDLALLRVSEADRGGDQDGDGDADDQVLELYDAGSGESTPLALAAGSAARLLPGQALAVLVDEAAQGRDLNGDGDRADEVLFLRAARP